jgi:putative membrane protein
MYVKRRYSFWMTFNWSKWPFIIGIIYNFLISAIYYFSNIAISLPWGPLTVIGIAVAFYLGFKNNSSYDRTWEARKIWGSIVNNSRTFAAAVVAFIQGEKQEEIRKELVYRHIAWMTALRHQLRLSKEWEHVENRLNGLYAPTVCEDYNNKLDGELSQYISNNELEQLNGKTNKATQILKIQSQRLQEIRDKDYYDDFRHMQFHQLIGSFYTDQGKSERIKNFPFPRQYASVTLWITLVFTALIPFGLLDIMINKEPWMIWISPFLGGLITWVFYLMEKIGDYTENPFEGTYNDIPITSISRTIEIDMREMIDDTKIPAPIKDSNGFLM